MNKREKEVIQAQLDSEKAVLKQLEKQYQTALNDINRKIRLLTTDELTQSKIYQIEYQKALKKQIEGILDKLQGDEYSTIHQYLHDSYTMAFVGTAYDLAGQGIPLIMPIDQAAAVKAIQTDSKISEGLYNALGVDVKNLKKAISNEVARGIATNQTFADIARNISNVSKAPIANAKRIARTEGHRIQQASTYDAQVTAKSKGADVVKQWDSTMDGGTRKTHRELDGQIREVNEPFKLWGMEAMFPGDFGDPAEDCNCRCVSLTRAKWGLNEDELQTLKDRAKYFGLDKTKDFEDFKKKYLQVGLSSGKAGDSDGYTTIDEVVDFNFSDKKAIKKEINSFMEQYSEAKEEHAFVFSPSGKLYKLTGTSVNVNTGLVGDDDLVGSISIHNHPVGKGEDRADSFSKQDVMFAIEHKTGLDYLVSGIRKEAFVYTGKLSASAIGEEYENAKKKALEIAFDTETSVEYWQEAAMMGLAESLEGFVFYENI